MKIEKYIIGVITLIAIGAIGTAIYFGLNNNDNVNNSYGENEKENVNQENISGENNAESVNNITTITIDKTKINEELNEKLYHPLYKVTDFVFNDIDNNINYLDSRKNKVVFMWEVLNDSEVDAKDVIEEKTVSGEDVTGAIAYSELLVLSTYKKLYGESITLNEILNSNSELKYKDGYIYGNFVTGWGAPDFLLKVTSLVYDNYTNMYEMSIDFLTKGVFENSNNSLYFNVDYDFIEKYYESNSYPADAVYTKLKIMYDKNHVLKSIVFEK